MIAYHTSGSTGTPLDFYWTKHNLQFYWAIVERFHHRFGIEPNDKHLNFTGKIVVPLNQNRPPYWRYRSAQHQAMINMQHLTAEKVPAIVDYINKGDFKYIVGYPSIVYEFSRLVNELGLKIKSIPKFYFSSAEKLYTNQCFEIEKAFPGLVCVEHYGFSENAASASKRPGDDAYFEDFELGCFELDRDGDSGNLLVTGFQNYAMPFIRYEIGDRVLLDNNTSHPLRFLDIEGRSEDYVITPEGTHIMRFDYIFKGVDNIKETQVVQRELGSVIIRIVRREGFDKTNIEEKLRKTIAESISPSLSVAFEYVDKIERTKAGKFRAVVSELKR